MANLIKLRVMLEDENFPPLHTAVYKDDIITFEHLLRQRDTDVSAVVCGFTALDFTVLYQRQHMAKMLLSHLGINVNLQPEQTFTPVCLAPSMPSSQILRYFLDHKDTDVNYTDGYRAPAFPSACMFGQASNVDLILNYGTAVNKRFKHEKFGRTPSHNAAYYGYTEVINILIKNQCFQASALNNKGENPIQMAMLGNHNETVISCLRKFDKIFPGIKESYPKGQDILLNLLPYASKLGRVAVVKYLSERIGMTPILNYNNFCECIKKAFHFNKSMCASLLLTILSRNTSPLMLEKVEELWFIATRKGTKDLLQQLYGIWHETLFLRFSCKSKDKPNKESIGHLPKQIRIEHIEKFSDSFDASASDKILMALYHSIRLGIVQFVKFVLTSHCEIHRKKFADMLPEKKISLINISLQNSEIENVINEGRGLYSTEIYRKWYTKLKDMSTKIPSSSTLDQFKMYSVMDSLREQIEQNSISDEKRLVHSCVHELMTQFSIEIAKINEIFQFKPILVGSAKEGTRPILPNEFDYLIIFENLNKFLEVKETYEFSYPPTFTVAGKESMKESLKEYLSLSVSGEIQEPEFFTLLEELFLKAKNTIATEKPFSNIVFEPKFFVMNSVPCLHITWRGNEYMDMEIKIDIVPALELTAFCPVYSFIPENCNFYLFFKQNHRPSIAFSDAEIKLIGSLPQAARDGFKFAKSVRVAKLFPWHIVEAIKDEALYIDDYLTTYMLKTCLLFCALHDPSATKDLNDIEWAFLIYQHFRLRIVAGILPNLFGIYRTFPLPTYTIGDIFFCSDATNGIFDRKRACCVKRQNLLSITDWILNFLSKYCAKKGIDVSRIVLIAETAMSFVPEIIREMPNK